MPATLPAAQKKQPTNLSLSPRSIRIGQKYAEAHQTSLSKVVDELLSALRQGFEGGGLSDAGDPGDPLDGLLARSPLAKLDKRSMRETAHQARLGR